MKKFNSITRAIKKLKLIEEKYKNYGNLIER